MRMLLGMAAAMLATTASAEKSVVTADRYLDVATGRYIENPAIFVGDDGRITAVSDARTVRWGADVKHIDLAGRRQWGQRIHGSRAEGHSLYVLDFGHGHKVFTFVTWAAEE